MFKVLLDPIIVNDPDENEYISSEIGEAVVIKSQNLKIINIYKTEFILTLGKR